MKTVKVNKLWGGCVSIRSHIVQLAIDKGEDLIVEYNGKAMRIPWIKLKSPDKVNKDIFKSVYPSGRTTSYTLLDFKWSPSGGEI